MRRWLQLLWLVAFLFVGRLADADSSFPGTFTKSTADDLAVEVPLVRDERARVIIAREPETDESDRQLLDTVGFRPATKEEIAAGKATHTGIATHYYDFRRGTTYGSVTGDGRAVLVGDVAVRDQKTGRIVGVFDIQAKGIGTGLRPAQVPEEHWHAHGKERLKQALVDMMGADYLERNGVRANKWVAVIDTGIQTVPTKGGTATEHMALSVRGGNFMRMAHLNYFRDKPVALRELVDYTNRTLAMELGRTTPLSPAGLYRELTQRKANELADLYWSRVLHGSITYDNIGLFETMDMGTLTALDRMHPTFQTAEAPVSPGVSGEAEKVLSRYYVTELKELVTKAYSPNAWRKITPDEARQLEELKKEDGPKLVEHMFRERMGANALQHLGFDDEDVKMVMKHRRELVTGKGGLLDTLRTIAEHAEKGATWQMGSADARWRANVKDPARYDLFAGLRSLVAIMASNEAVDAKVEKLAKALEPIGGVTDADRANARTLLVKLAPVVAYATGHLEGAPKAAKIELVKDQALRINESVGTAVYTSTTSVADWMIERLDRNEPVGRVRAEMRSYLRNQVRRGPESAGGVASRLRRGEMEKEGAFHKLSAHEENAVVIEEMSDGVHDKIRVTLRGDPMKTNDPHRVEMAFTTNANRSWPWALVRPVRVQNGDAVYEVDVTPEMRADLSASDFQANFRDTHTDKRFDNYGWSFGKGARYVLGSPLVDAELAQVAHVAKAERTQTPEANRQAVSARALPQRQAPPVPKALLVKTDDTLHIRRDLVPTEPPPNVQFATSRPGAPTPPPVRPPSPRGPVAAPARAMAMH